jgi:predicted phosphoribosyltransferase
MTDRSGIVKKYAETEKKLMMTLAEAEALSTELALRIRQKVTRDTSDSQLIVVGIANGGLMVAKIVSEKLGFPFETIRIRRSGSRLKRKIGEYSWLLRLIETLLRNRLLKKMWQGMNRKMKTLEIETGDVTSTTAEQPLVSFVSKHVILVDDCILSGETIRLAKETLLDAGAQDVTTGVLTLKNKERDPNKSKQFDPIVYLNTNTQHYPWSQNNKEYENFINWLHEKDIKPWL